MGNIKVFRRYFELLEVGYSTKESYTVIGIQKTIHRPPSHEGDSEKMVNICKISFVIFLFIIPQTVFGDELVPVEGQHCYQYGDDETVSMAKKKSLALAREIALSNYKVWVESNTIVKNFMLEKDWVETIAVGMLQHETRHITKKVQEICTTIKAKINPLEIDALLAERRKQSAIKQLVTTQVSASTFGLEVWLDNPDGQYVEGDYIVINVRSDQDAYLKLDYYQADCRVVHLVPNLFRAQVFIKKDKVYTFGTENSQERFRVKGPFGQEVIKAIASKEPFPASQIPHETISSCESYVKTLEEEVRGIALEQNLASTEASLFSSSLKKS